MSPENKKTGPIPIIPELLQDLSMPARIARIESTVFETHTMVREHLVEYKRDKEVLEKHSTEIWGNNGNVGLSKKMDRMEQMEEGRKWLIRALGAASIGLIVKQVVDLIHK